MLFMVGWAPMGKEALRWSLHEECSLRSALEVNICPWGEGKHKEMEAQVVNGQLARGQCQVEKQIPALGKAQLFSSKESISEEALAQKK